MSGKNGRDSRGKFVKGILVVQDAPRGPARTSTSQLPPEPSPLRYGWKLSGWR